MRWNLVGKASLRGHHIQTQTQAAGTGTHRNKHTKAQLHTGATYTGSGTHRAYAKEQLLEKDCTGMAGQQLPPCRTAVSHPRSGLESLPG